MVRSKSSSKWLNEHHKDEYVLKARQEGYRSRASYKLLEIQEKDQLFKRGMNVLDLGAAPGGWSQVAAKLVGERGKVFATDILEMDALEDVTFLQGDFREENIFEQLLEMLAESPIDIVMSDMAPNFSGVRSADQPRAMYLMELALDMACRVLKPGGSFVVKLFEGEGIEEFRREAQAAFGKVMTRKPKASRGRSRESYLVALNFKG